MSFLALRDLMQVIGYSAAAWIFPAIIDTAVAVSTLASYLAALGVDAKIVVEVCGQTVTYDLTVGRGTR